MPSKGASFNFIQRKITEIALKEHICIDPTVPIKQLDKTTDKIANLINPRH